MGNEAQVQQVELHIDEAKEGIKLRDSLHRLQNNPDFKKVINEAYFRDEAARLVAAKSNVGMQTPESQMFIDNSIIGLGALQQFFISMEQKAGMFEKSLIDDQETRTELLGDIN